MFDTRTRGKSVRGQKLNKSNDRIKCKHQNQRAHNDGQQNGPRVDKPNITIDEANGQRNEGVQGLIQRWTQLTKQKYYCFPCCSVTA